MSTVAAETASSRRRRLLIALAGTVAGIAFLLAIASLAFGGDSGFLVMRSVAHPIFYALTFAIGFSVAVLAASGRLRPAVGTAAVGTVTVLAMVALPRVWGAGWEEPDRSYRSPDGQHALVVDTWSAMIDPMWTLRLEETSGLTARYWTLGCVNGDVDELKSVRWESRNDLVVTVDSGEKHVVIDTKGRRTVDSALTSC